MKVNLSAPINSLGYGVVGANILKSLVQAQVDVALWPIGTSDWEDFISGEMFSEAVANQIQQDFSAAPSVRLFHEFSLKEHPPASMRVGFPIFELNRFSAASVDNLQSQDRIFVPSSWAKQIVLDALPKADVRVVPLGVDTERFSPREFPAEGTPTTFLNVGKWEIRKGHDILLKAFERAFTPADNVCLVMHCYNPCLVGQRYNQGWERLYRSSKMAEKIILTGGRSKSQLSIVDLVANCHCGVFPYRAEGWNLDMLECLSMGRHVIATNYSGPREYLSLDNSMTIYPLRLEEAHDGVWFFGQGEWASLGEREIDEFADKMRQVHKSCQAGSLQVNNEGIKIAAAFSWQRLAPRFMFNLEQ